MGKIKNDSFHKKSIQYCINFIGDDDDVAECRRDLITFTKDGKFKMLDIERIMPLPEGHGEDSYIDLRWKCVERGSLEPEHIREDGLKHLLFDNDDFLVSPKVFEAIVEKHPKVKLAVVEGMDNEYGRGSTTTSYEYIGGKVITEIMLISSGLDIPQLDNENDRVEEASWLKHLAKKSPLGVLLNHTECMAAGMEPGAMMYPDEKIYGVGKDKSLFATKEEALDFVHFIRDSCYQKVAERNKIEEIGQFIDYYGKTLDKLDLRNCERFVKQLFAHEEKALGSLKHSMKYFRERRDLKEKMEKEFAESMYSYDFSGFNKRIRGRSNSGR